MKKIFFLSIIVLVYFNLAITNCSAQKLYYGIHGGYALSLASQNLTSKIDDGIAQVSNVVVKGSFGRGVMVDGYIGYKKNEHIGIELGASYLAGNNYKGHYTKEIDFNENTSISANMFRVIPAICFTIGERKIKSYVKIGVVFRVFGKITLEESHYDIKNNTTIETEWQFSNGLSVGISTSLGITKKINDRLSVFGELAMISQSWGPKKGRATKYAIDGTDMLSNLNPYQKQTSFIDNYTTTNNAISMWYPREQLKQYYPFSSIGINIGIQFYFGK